MAPDRDAVGRPSSGATTPPSAEMGTLAEEQELVVGSEYWVVDDTGAEVWSLVEVLELCDRHVVAKLVDCGKRKEIDLVSSERNNKKAQRPSSKPAIDVLCVLPSMLGVRRAARFLLVHSFMSALRVLSSEGPVPISLC